MSGILNWRKCKKCGEMFDVATNYPLCKKCRGKIIKEVENVKEI